LFLLGEGEIVASVAGLLLLLLLFFYIYLWSKDGATPSISTLRFLFDWKMELTRDLSTSFFPIHGGARER
jgi:hypothetical protein